jgi:hypothetical protein
MFGQGDPASLGVYVAVEDADAHYERAKAVGAEIVREIEMRTTARVSTCPPRFVHDSYELRATTLGLGTGTALVPDAHEAEMGIRRVRVRADGTVAAANPGRADRSVGAWQAPINGS